VSLLGTIRVAIKALLRNKLRSFLTTLGIIIGVFSVIVMVAVGEGAKARVEASFASLGTNLLIILSGTTTRGGVFSGFGSMPTLTWRDLQAIREVPSVRYAAASLRTVAQVQSEHENWGTSITGTSPAYFEIRDWPIAMGRGFTASDMDGAAKVAILGQTVVTRLFGRNADPVGRVVLIKNVPFQVIGVLARKGQSATGQDNDDAVFIPQTTFQTRIEGGLQNYIPGVIMVSARSASTTALAASQITRLLRERHHIPSGGDDDFSIRNLTQVAETVEAGAATLTTLLAAVAAVSLLVGGIGIMNIMLVSVTERTREIGLRMAVGAKPRHVLAQFLVEALTLSVTGGIIGISLGVLTAEMLARRWGWPMSFRADVILVSVGFSGLVGVGFGLYPARKASRLDPIDALHYE
jgi:putative ABC transport system permease protein